jgi:hypothetical protein
VTTEEDDSATLNEDFAKLLLDSSLALRMTDDELLDFSELNDSSFFEDEDFAFSLQLDPSTNSTGSSTGSGTFEELLDCGVTLEEDGSTPSGAALLLLSSPHADNASIKGNKKTTKDCHHHALLVAGFALRLLAMTFRIRTPSPQRPVI